MVTKTRTSGIMNLQRVQNEDIQKKHLFSHNSQAHKTTGSVPKGRWKDFAERGLKNREVFWRMVVERALLQSVVHQQVNITSSSCLGRFFAKYQNFQVRVGSFLRM